MDISTSIPQSYLIKCPTSMENITNHLTNCVQEQIILNWSLVILKFTSMEISKLRNWFQFQFQNARKSVMVFKLHITWDLVDFHKESIIFQKIMNGKSSLKQEIFTFYRLGTCYGFLVDFGNHLQHLLELQVKFLWNGNKCFCLILVELEHLSWCLSKWNISMWRVPWKYSNSTFFTEEVSFFTLFPKLTQRFHLHDWLCNWIEWKDRNSHWWAPCLTSWITSLGYRW